MTGRLREVRKVEQGRAGVIDQNTDLRLKKVIKVASDEFADSCLELLACPFVLEFLPELEGGVLQLETQS